METDWIKVWIKKRDKRPNNENQQEVSARKQSKSHSGRFQGNQNTQTLTLLTLLIKPTEGKTYADVLRRIVNSVDPEITQTGVKLVWRTKAGDVLVEIEDTSVNKGAFGNALKNNLGENAVDRHLEPMTTVDMDFITTVYRKP